jgi:molybdopterin converting factor small subunit
MRVTVRLFALARDIVGRDVLPFEVPPGATLGELRNRLAAEYPSLTALLARSALAVRDDIAGDAEHLEAGAEVAVLPPVSGG